MINLRTETKVHVEVIAKSSNEIPVQRADVEILGEYSNFTKECSRGYSAVGPIDYVSERRLIDGNQNLPLKIVKKNCTLDIQSIVVRTKFGLERIAEAALLVNQELDEITGNLNCFDFGVGPPVCIMPTANRIKIDESKLIGKISIRLNFVE